LKANVMVSVFIICFAEYVGKRGPTQDCIFSLEYVIFCLFVEVIYMFVIGTVKFKSLAACNDTYTQTHRSGSGRASLVGKTPKFLCFEVLKRGGNFACIVLQYTLNFSCAEFSPTI